MINKYLQYIQESISSRNLPKDLIQAMKNHENFQYMHSVNEIDKLNKMELKLFNDQLKQATKKKTEDPDWFKIVNAELKLIKDKKLYCILNYGNGDTAWFSFLDKKIYDFGHEGNSFSTLRHLTDIPNVDKRCWPPTPYKQWIKDVMSGKHQDSWR